MDKILVVDDVQQNLDLISKYLQNAGFEVSTANNGLTALKKAKYIIPDLIIMDVVMPKMSGIDVCKMIKEDKDTRFTTVLIITALDTSQYRIKAMEAGADDYMPKPFDKTMLLSKVNALLRVKHLSDQLKKQYAEINEKNAIFEMQLDMARRVQQSLVKSNKFKKDGVTFISRYMPAMSIGGDLYDIAVLENNLVSILMSDVSGHGISAALLTSMMKSMFKNLVNTFKQPDLILYHMNNEFFNVFDFSEKDDKDMEIYACAFCAFIDVKNNTVTFSNAGHTLPILVNGREHTAKELTASGLPLGMIERSQYTRFVERYDDGDLLFFHTDGLSDSFYKDAPEEFSLRIKELLLSLNNNTSPEEIVDIIVDQFYDDSESGKILNDDASIILCKM